MKRALLVIDVQNEYFSGALPVTHPEGSLDNILKAMDAASQSGIPVVVVRHSSRRPGSGAFDRCAQRRFPCLVAPPSPQQFPSKGIIK
jgi:nicotinamidase-related amidase